MVHNLNNFDVDLRSERLFWSDESHTREFALAEINLVRYLSPGKPRPGYTLFLPDGFYSDLTYEYIGTSKDIGGDTRYSSHMFRVRKLGYESTPIVRVGVKKRSIYPEQLTPIIQELIDKAFAHG